MNNGFKFGKFLKEKKNRQNFWFNRLKPIAGLLVPLAMHLSTSLGEAYLLNDNGRMHKYKIICVNTFSSISLIHCVFRL